MHICKLNQTSKSKRIKSSKLRTTNNVSIPWRMLCNTCIGPFMIEDSDFSKVNFMYVKMIDHVMLWFEMEQILLSDVVS